MNYLPSLRDIILALLGMSGVFFFGFLTIFKSNKNAHTKREVENALTVAKLEELEKEQKAQFGGNSNGIRQKVDTNAAIEKEHNDVVVKALESLVRELKAVSLVSNETATILREHIRWAETSSVK